MTDLGPVPCPSCTGARLPGPDPRGVLAWQHAQTCPLLAAEDATQAHDYALALPHYVMTRPSTDTERTLLGVLGMVTADGTPPTPELDTHVWFSSDGIRARCWPDLSLPAEEATA